MVQEARLDLSRAAKRFGLALGLAASVGTLAQAQPLVSNPGLTSLMQPQLLDRSRPLVSQDRAAGTRSGLQQGGPLGAAPCDRRTAAAPGGIPAAPAGPSLYGSGSGPGTYGRYVPGATPPADSAAKGTAAPTAPPGTTRTATADRPLYGGVDRPLWDTGERRAAAAAGNAPGKTAPKTEAGQDAGGKDSASAAPVQPNALPPPVRDRPLWMDGSLSGVPGAAAAPGANVAASDVGGGIASAPCTAAPGRAGAPLGR